jgi:thiol:disulfide interchange protein/DsbC/DsbD-like thiol-disulfide interchange protein
MMTKLPSIIMYFLRLTALLLAFICTPVIAQIPGATLNVPATLRAETSAPAPGQTVTLAFVMEPKKGWHGYFENPGDAGFGMQLNWDLPKGVTAGKPRYPVPSTLIISGLMNYVYERPYAVLVDLQIAPQVAVGSKLPIKVRADWLACTDKICVPEGDDLTINLTAGQGKVAAGSRAQFDAYRAALPVPLDQTAQYAVRGKILEIAFPFPADAKAEQPYFFALTNDVIDYSVPQSARRVGDVLIVTMGLREGAKPDSIWGVLRYSKEQDTTAQGLIVVATLGVVPSGGVAVTPTQAAQSELSTPNSFGWILGCSVLGGLILNLMPCVFPILGLKAVSLAKMGGDAGAAKRDALAYSAGVILSVVALGGIMLALRSAGQQVGWAFQLQEPRIVLLLLLLMTAVTLNLAGGFEVASVSGGGSLTQKQGAAGSFWTGVLAAVVATPCTGPFMAAATGAALLLPTASALLVFAGLGFGLALPYLAIAYVPLFRRWMPKPGPWLARFKTAMAVPMALTAAALLWLLWRVSGSYGLILGIVAAAFLTGIMTLLGRMQRRGQGGLLLAGLALAIALASVLILPRDAVMSQAPESGLLQAQPYSDTRLAEYRKAGNPVFVYFTADWCVTCKVNEAAAIERPATAAAFEKAGVKTLVGDFTRRDPALSRVLAKHGRSGVPLYLYYPKGGEARVLPQILTPQIMADLAQ